jgi:hypothetical protein
MSLAALRAAMKLAAEVCAEVEFTPPPADGSLHDWVSTVLDWPLAPRGGEPWAEAHAVLVEAYTAALAGSRPILRERLIVVRDLVRAHGNRYCACPEPRAPLAPDPTTKRPLCFRCRLRRR